MRVVIVGGGIVGLASAYYLADRGVDVTVLETRSLGSGSTGRANGGIREQFTSGVSIGLSRESVRVWERFEETFDTDIAYRRPGYLFLARTAETADRFHEHVSLQADHGVGSEFLSPEEAVEHCPGLYPDVYVGATYCPTDGFADPHLALQGFARAATDAGVTVRTGVAVTDVRVADGAVTGVESTGGRHDADFVVNAAGPWAARVGAMAGLDLPVSPRRRQLLVADPEQPLPETVPLTVDVDEGVHFRPERDGRAVVGGHFAETDPEQDPDRYRTAPDLAWATETLDTVSTVAAYFGPGTELVGGWAGLYAVTPDHHPVIEEPIPGFVNAVGFSGHGFMQSPATGRVVSELVVDGEARTVDVSALRADRFERGEALYEGSVID